MSLNFEFLRVLEAEWFEKIPALHKRLAIALGQFFLGTFVNFKLVDSLSLAVEKQIFKLKIETCELNIRVVQRI